MMAVGSAGAELVGLWTGGVVAGCEVDAACAAPSREVEMIRTSVCTRVRMGAPVGILAILDCTTVDPSLSVERWSAPVCRAGTPGAPSHQSDHSAEIVAAAEFRCGVQLEVLVGGIHRGDCRDWCGYGFFRWRMRENGLRLAPITVAVGHHHVEAPVPAFLLGFDQTERVQVEQVVLDETDLIFRQTAALEIDRDAGEMRRRRIAFGGSSVAIATAKLLLHLDGADGRVYLDLIVELAVINFGKVLHEIASPRTAIAARGIKAVLNLQRLALLDGHQITRGFECFQFF